MGEMCRGLTSRPRESAGVTFLDELLVLFQYPPRSAPAPLGGGRRGRGTLPFKVLCVYYVCE